MKRGYKFAAGFTIILLISGYFYYTFPQKINKTYNGIKYKLGDPQQQEHILQFVHRMVKAAGIIRME